MADYSKYNDVELVRELKGGNIAAYKEIYDRYWQLLFRFSRKLLQDNSLAEDVVQDVFTVLWLKAGTLDPKVPIAAYLYRLTRNKILDNVKHSKVEARYLDHLKQVMQLGDALPDQLHIERELFDKIEREINNLPEKMRVVFNMRRNDFKSNQQIADELGISNQTVKNQLSNASRILKGKLGDSLNIFLIFF